MTAGAKQRTKPGQRANVTDSKKEPFSLSPKARVRSRGSPPSQRPSSPKSTCPVDDRAQSTYPRLSEDAAIAPVVTQVEFQPRASSSISAPVPAVLRCKASTTMPGSLFPRSASLEPDATSMIETSAVRPPRRTESGSCKPSSSRTSSTQEVSFLRSPNPFVTDHSAAARAVISSTDDAIRFLEEYQSSPPNSPTPALTVSARGAAPGRRSSTADNVNTFWKAKGKARATDSDVESDIADTSRELRVRGKERELRDAREEHLRKEQRRVLDPETSLILEERELDKEKIRKLEEEVAWLRSQVKVLKPSLSLVDTDRALSVG